MHFLPLGLLTRLVQVLAVELIAQLVQLTQYPNLPPCSFLALDYSVLLYSGRSLGSN